MAQKAQEISTLATAKKAVESELNMAERESERLQSKLAQTEQALQDEKALVLDLTNRELLKTKEAAQLAQQHRMGLEQVFNMCIIHVQLVQQHRMGSSRY